VSAGAAPAITGNKAITQGANHAPVLDAGATPALGNATVGAGSPVGAVGALVSMIAGANVTDVDSGAALGVAIVAADTALGAWWYSIDDGASWSTLGAVSDASARLLSADARLFFAATMTGSAVITFRAWDQTSGVNGALASSAVNGGASAFSTATDTASVNATAANVPPLAADDAASVAFGGVTSIAVASNDSDADGTLDLASVVIATQAAHGSLTVGAGGDVTYTHDGGAAGADAFTYTIDDTLGATSNIATVTVTIAPAATGGTGATGSTDSGDTGSEQMNPPPMNAPTISPRSGCRCHASAEGEGFAWSALLALFFFFRRQRSPSNALTCCKSALGKKGLAKKSRPGRASISLGKSVAV
jgi:hypothetical protein